MDNAAKTKATMSRKTAVSFLGDELDKVCAAVTAIDAIISTLAEDNASQDCIETCGFKLTSFVREGLMGGATLLVNKAHDHCRAATCFLQELADA